eukprot:7652663-Lingulodinium_polyedra.AAC.1
MLSRVWGGTALTRESQGKGKRGDRRVTRVKVDAAQGDCRHAANPGLHSEAQTPEFRLGECLGAAGHEC